MNINFIAGWSFLVGGLLMTVLCIGTMIRDRKKIEKMLVYSMTLMVFLLTILLGFLYINK